MDRTESVRKRARHAINRSEFESKPITMAVPPMIVVKASPEVISVAENCESSKILPTPRSSVEIALPLVEPAFVDTIDTSRTLPPKSTGSLSPLPLFSTRRRQSTKIRDAKTDDFYSDKSRIVFCSSSRRMMQKAQVFSLESNTFVRNRLTHTLEVADIGRTLGRAVGRKLEKKGRTFSVNEIEWMETIVESACLMHDIGNPPFGHFGEEAIKRWFEENGPNLLAKADGQGALGLGRESIDPRLNDFALFDGNPQGFRIVTRLHNEVDEFGLNLTDATLLAAVKYPNVGKLPQSGNFSKKIGIFSSEADIYAAMCKRCSIKPGRRYFLAYLMELADDICYCLSDIADSFEKGITSSREFLAEFREICRDENVFPGDLLPSKINNFSYDVSIKVASRLIDEAADVFSTQIDQYLTGEARELWEDLPSGKILRCFKIFARRFIYTYREVQRIEIAGERVVEGLLNHYGRLLRLSRKQFTHFVEQDEVPKNSHLDTEWRIFKQLSPRMLKVYRNASRHKSDGDEWIARARLIVDYISGLTDRSAWDFYQNFMGIKL